MQTQTIPLFGDYSARALSAEEFGPLMQELRPRVFDGTLDFDVQAALSEPERQAVAGLTQRMEGLFTLQWGLYHGDTLIGWTAGRQMNRETFHMTNTALFPEHRNKGVYSAVLPRVLERAAAEGFQVVSSLHNATNNAVIVPKIKAGFVITGLTLSDSYGLLVDLSYFFNPLRRRAMDFRAGQCRADEELARHLTLFPDL